MQRIKRKKVHQDKISKSEALINLYNKRIDNVVALFYSEITKDEKANEILYDDYNKAWKTLAYRVNSTQKLTTINPMAFELRIENYKQIALNQAIKQTENGEEINEESQA